MKIYDPKKIEAKWRQYWHDEGIYRTDESADTAKEKAYVLGMFPYPSGEGLHTGHVRIFTACDVMARYLRMKGQSVLLPMGWDAFGLPAENAAIKRKVNPIDMVPKNEENFKRQMEMVGLSYDWDKAFSTTDPEYYKWTQWLFLKLYSVKNDKGERLVYRKEVAINWCPVCKTGLANEEVMADGSHERCGNKVEQRQMMQWVMRITDYADRLLDDLEGLDWPKGILEMQRNWIGKKEGRRIKFLISKDKDLSNVSVTHLEVFTTKPETMPGVTFLVISPEKAKEILVDATPEVKDYIEKSLLKSEQVRLEDAKEKTGVDTGLVAVNPLNGEEVPVWVADYVLSEVGTGAVMGVPSKDSRDRAFADKYKLSIKEFDEAENDLGEKQTNYHLRDWVFSRQRYWGEPFPLVYCDKCGDENGVVTVPEDQLPVKLPYLESYEPAESGQSPLSLASDWVEIACPNCGGKARRETDTMPNWAGSCWYYLAFPSWNRQGLSLPADGGSPLRSFQGRTLTEEWSDKFKPGISNWLPVDWYLGGAEHAVLHLLYARFWTKVFADLGLVDFSEPFTRLRSVGLVLAEDGKKMSKSLGNVVNPDDMVARFGADTLRIYEMFMGPWDQAIAWETRSMVGGYRFLEKVWNLYQQDLSGQSTDQLKNKLNKLVAKVGGDIAELKFNTAVAAMMEFVNSWHKTASGDEGAGLSRDDAEKFLLLLAPIAPFMTEEIWHSLGNEGSVHVENWPDFAEVRESRTAVVVQVNGKVRGVLTMDAQDSMVQETVEGAAREESKISKWLTGDQKVIFVPGRVINFVS